MSAQTFSRPNAFSLIVLMALGCVYFGSPGDLDFCWQIRTGERILDTGRLKQTDTFSYTIAGRELPDHEWLYEVLLALVWRGLGDGGMKLVRVALCTAPLAILAWQLHRRGVKRHGIALTLLALALVLFYFERLRPLVCSTIGLQLVSSWLHDHSHGRKRLDWKLPVTMLLWGNLHPAVIMGQALLVGTIAWELTSRWRLRAQPAQAERKSASGLVWWCALGLLASLVAPNPVGRFLYPFASELRHPAQRLFVEIRPPWRFLGQAPHIIDFALILGVFFGAILVLRRRELRGWEWALVIGLTGLATTATRATSDWLLITAALAVPQVGPLLRRLTESRRERLARLILRVDRTLKKILQGPLLRPQAAWSAAAVAVFALISLLPLGSRLPNREGKHWPTEPVNWIAEHGLPGPEPWNIFSGSDEGTYLLWRLPGRARVYSDTRGFYYSGDLLLDSFFLPAADEEWPQRLQRVLGHGTQYFLLRTDSSFWKLLEPQGPETLYRDGQFVILTAEQVKLAANKINSPGKDPQMAQVHRD